MAEEEDGILLWVDILHVVVMKKNHQDVGKTAESNLCVHCIRQKGIPRINVLSLMVS